MPFKFIGRKIGITSEVYDAFADICHLLKTLRLKKIEYAVRSSNLHKNSKAKLIVIFWLVIIVIYTHTLACLIWWSLQEEQRWMTPLDAGIFGTRIYEAEKSSMGKSFMKMERELFWF